MHKPGMKHVSGEREWVQRNMANSCPSSEASSICLLTSICEVCTPTEVRILPDISDLVTDRFGSGVWLLL